MAATIETESLSKRYLLGEDFAHYHYGTLREALRFGWRRRQEPRPELWALREVTLSIEAGDVVGLIGRNGAGKSTLLKILAHITAPTVGIARTRGRVGALIEVGTGFHPELTGGENVFLNGAILGMSRRDVARRFDEIVAFAGVENFVDTPLKRYSTGMSLRLAFAVAAHLEPPILAVDEVLAVGDAEFKRRCLQKMAHFGDAGGTIVFVSHDLGAIAQLCGRTVWLDEGSVAADGTTADVINAYVDSGMSQTLRAEPASGAFRGRQGGAVAVRSIEIVDGDGRRMDRPRRDLAFGVKVEFEVAARLSRLDLAVYLVNHQGARAVDESFSDTGELCLAGEPGRYEATLTIPPVLASDDYALGVWMGTEHDTYVQVEPFSFRLWPRPEDPLEWIERARVTQAPVAWRVEPRGSTAAASGAEVSS